MWNVNHTINCDRWSQHGNMSSPEKTQRMYLSFFILVDAACLYGALIELANVINQLSKKEEAFVIWRKNLYLWHAEVKIVMFYSTFLMSSHVLLLVFPFLGKWFFSFCAPRPKVQVISDITFSTFGCFLGQSVSSALKKSFRGICYKTLRWEFAPSFFIYKSYFHPK